MRLTVYRLLKSMILSFHSPSPSPSGIHRASMLSIDMEEKEEKEKMEKLSLCNEEWERDSPRRSSEELGDIDADKHSNHGHRQREQRDHRRSHEHGHGHGHGHSHGGNGEDMNEKRY